MQAKMGEQTAAPEMPVTVDPEQLRIRMQELRKGQNLAMGCVAGLLAAAVGAALWAGISYATDYQIGWMAVGVGLLVGVAVRQLGKGIDRVFGIVGAALALLGCLAGNLLTVLLVVSREKGVPFLELVSRLDAEVVLNVMGATFSPMDLVFYGIAIYVGYKYSVRGVPEGAPAGTAA